jgi:hypothetical protein
MVRAQFCVALEGKESEIFLTRILHLLLELGQFWLSDSGTVIMTYCSVSHIYDNCY